MRIEFDNDEGPGDVFQMLADNMEGLEVEVVPVDGPEFEAILVGGREDGDSDWDEIQVRRVYGADDNLEAIGKIEYLRLSAMDLMPVGEPEYLRVKGLRLRS